MSPEQAEFNELGHRHPQRHLRPGRAAVRAADRHDAVREEAAAARPRSTRSCGSSARRSRPSRARGSSATRATLPSIAGPAAGPEPSASWRRLVQGELDWIVMKALEKDRNRRYETANGLAMDVQRYLADEPVQACPPSAGYRLRKFVRRNKGPVLAASLVVLALVGGIIGTTWGLIRATDARAVAVNEAKQKEAALAAARQSERDATDQLFLALLEPGPRRPLQPADGPAAGQPRRPGPGRPHPARRAAARRGHRRDGPARRPPRAGPALLAPRHRRGGVRRAVPALRPRRHPGDHQHPQHPRRPGDPAHRLGPDPGEVPVLQPRRPVPARPRRRVHAARVARGRRATGPPGRAPRVPGACVQPGRPAPGGRPAGVGPLLRPGDGSGSQALALARDGPRRWRFTRTAASWPSGTSIRASLPCTTRRAGPSSPTCPWAR